MTEDDVIKNTFSNPLGLSAYKQAPFHFVDREYLIITYRTDPEALARVIPAPLMPAEPIVKYEFIKMPDSSGLGDYVETGQVIPVTLDGKPGGYTHRMFLNNHPAVFSGREMYGFPKQLGQPTFELRNDAIVGTLDMNGVRVATATMAYKQEAIDPETIAAGMTAPSYLVKVIPHVDGSHRVLELVNCKLGGIKVKGAWTGPASLELHPHCFSDMHQLPVLEILSATHYVADLSIVGAEVVHDYLAAPEKAPVRQLEEVA